MRFKGRYFAVLGLPLVMAQCQPACTPAPPPPVVSTTTTTTAPPPVETTQPPPPVTTQPPVTTLPVIPLGVTVTRECSAFDPWIGVTNDSSRPIQFAWVDTPPQHALMLGGESMLKAWPLDANGQPVLSVDWTASDPLNGAVFDQGQLFLHGSSGQLMDCDADFNAEIDESDSCPTADTVFATIFASAPAGYDKASFVFHVADFSDVQDHTEVFSLPMSSNRNASWSAEIPAPDGFGLPALSATVTFTDDDGVLPPVGYPNGGHGNTTPIPIHPEQLLMRRLLVPAMAKADSNRRYLFESSADPAAQASAVRDISVNVEEPVPSRDSCRRGRSG